MEFALNREWEFFPEWDDRYRFERGKGVKVTLPHTVVETPYNYFDESIYQKVSGYQRVVLVPNDAEGKRLFLNFGAAAHFATVFVNGEKVCEHHCGYTAFRVEVTDFLRCGEENLVAVRLDSRETLDQPPFGFVIDYMTYGGLYREVSIEATESERMVDVFLKPEVSKDSGEWEGVLRTEIQSEGDLNGVIVKQKILDPESVTICETEAPAAESVAISIPVYGVRLWDIVNPTLYTVATALVRMREDGTEQVLDYRTDRIGFRKAEFRADGFYLNEEKTFLHGLNRHQSFAYEGYAMPDRLQRKDADLLKYELGVNAVRTSHYPQSHAFIERCDELGILVFTEIPGWQHIGGEAWKKQAVENVRDMILEYRNYTSIVLWGVRINESPDEDALYQETNRVAHALDPTRQTGGVRCIPNSRLFEDVYTYNDFLHDGVHPGSSPREQITPENGHAYLISEHNGHMFPTKAFDDEYQLTEQMLRHARVLNSAMAAGNVAGAFGWCMFDYNTHQEFGSGDRICYHGVMDMFRNPKPAAYLYRAQGECVKPFLYVTSSMDIGEHPTGNPGKVYILTNCEEVKMYKNGVFLHAYTKADSEFCHLPHGPILITDYVGEALNDSESYPMGAELKKLLNYAAVYGLNNFGEEQFALAQKVAMATGMQMEQLQALYGEIVGTWGDRSVEYTFEAYQNGELVDRVVKAPVRSIGLAVDPVRSQLERGDSWDAEEIRIRAVDQNGNLLRFYQGCVELKATGSIKILGPSRITLRGGMGAAYVKTKCLAGPGMLRLDGGRLGIVDVRIDSVEEK